eukprot:gnl/MRDRNA2_/MRDRNA2_86616_c0_seq4.p1 gnl/MRDRNA2_/MRDRNA2_86616_c0~~gnl/MRDRNA2_/MRDRNA2_86616_c0_seq4.p1  ORF type:complete len:108 (-),score=3.05 gnl/MRDRNA2_/MRDRNA2_86616_c0_seq4:322-645(-)
MHRGLSMCSCSRVKLKSDLCAKHNMTSMVSVCTRRTAQEVLVKAYALNTPANFLAPPVWRRARRLSAACAAASCYLRLAGLQVCSPSTLLANQVDQARDTILSAKLT